MRVTTLGSSCCSAFFRNASLRKSVRQCTQTLEGSDWRPIFRWLSCSHLRQGRRKVNKKGSEDETPMTSSHDLPDCKYAFYGESTKAECSEPDYPLSIDADRVDTTEGRYYVCRSPKQTMHLPSVTTVVSETKSSGSYFALKKWRESVEQAQGEGSFEGYREKMLNRGQDFHKELEEWLLLSASNDKHEKKTVENTSGLSSPFYRSVEGILPEITDVKALESVVTHLDLGYMGRIDCIARYRGTLCVIDWKTSYKPRPSLKDMYDGPVQLVAYAGAVNSDPVYPFLVKSVMLVAVYDNGDPCDVHVISEEDCLHYWDKWMDRLRTFKTQFAHDLSDVY